MTRPTSSRTCGYGECSNAGEYRNLKRHMRQVHPVILNNAGFGKSSGQYALLITEGDKVGSSEATLLNMRGISPFSYGLVVKKVYDSGTVFDPKVLDLTEEDILASFSSGVRNVASVSLEIGVPTAASAPHSIINGFKNLLAIAAETDITFKEAEQMKEYLADPSKFAVAAAPAAAAAEAPAAAAPEAKEESEESDDDMGFGLFD